MKPLTNNVIKQQEAWAFALQSYKHSEIASACLDLQDRMNCNVNLLLFYHYLDTLGLAIASNDIETINCAIEVSERDLKRHRNERRKAKSQSEEKYADLLAQELSLEMAQHKLIVTAANRCEIASINQIPSTLVTYLKFNKMSDKQVDAFCDILNKRQIAELKA